MSKLSIYCILQWSIVAVFGLSTKSPNAGGRSLDQFAIVIYRITGRNPWAYNGYGCQ